MKINGVECMYRSFKGYFVTVKAINNDTEEMLTTEYFLEGDKFTGIQDILNTAKERFNAENIGYTAFKVCEPVFIKKRVAMSVKRFVAEGFEIDDNNKPIDGIVR